MSKLEQYREYRYVSMGEMGCFRSEVFCVLTFYADESYDNTTFCVGGWLHSVDGWTDLEGKWKQRIDYERRQSLKKGHVPISRFHAADCSNRRGEYEGWTVPRQKLFFKKLVGIICEHEPCAIAWGSSFNDLKLHFPQYKRKVAQRVLYYLCMQQCLRELTSIMSHSFSGERVTVIYDHGFNGAASLAFDMVKRNFDPTRSLMTIAPMQWEDCIALQPADLMAYEGSKLCYRHRTDNPEIRRSFQRILGTDAALSVGYLDEGVFVAAKKAFAEQSAKSVD